MKYSISVLVLCLGLVTFPSLTFAAKTHKIKKNDTLYSLAKKYHVTVHDIKSANSLVNRHIKSGDVLVIPPRPVSADGGAEAAKTKSAGVTYKVKRGDSLAKIARKTGVSVSELKSLNSLRANKVKPGRILVLRETEPVERTVSKVVKRHAPKSDALFSDGQYEQALAELTDFDPEKGVDLNKDMELTLDVSKSLNKTAYSFLGTRYRFGGTSRKGIDCSGFVQNVFRELEVKLPRTAREQYWVGEKVAQYDLQKGDLLFFRTYASYPSHVGIYLGDNKMIHASSRDRQVVISPITSYYRSRFIGAKRLAGLNPQLVKLEELFSGTGAEEEKEEDVTKNDTLGLSLTN
ncbi:MAG: murein/chitin-binding protein, LysM, LysM [Geobacteraceae bacterium]|jgi:LysM repeat protein|nr:murein/chitin-binding protein, LysM, LysM [Geobacteraceae bacterium]